MNRRHSEILGLALMRPPVVKRQRAALKKILNLFFTINADTLAGNKESRHIFYGDRVTHLLNGYTSNGKMKLPRGFFLKKLCLLVHIILFTALTSCLIIPTPWTKDKYDKEKIALVLDGSTKDDVIDQLGVPDIEWKTERVFVYKWKRVTAVWIVVPLAPNTGGAGVFRGPEALLILFNAVDRVEQIDAGSPQGGESYGDFLRRLLKQMKERNHNS